MAKKVTEIESKEEKVIKKPATPKQKVVKVVETDTELEKIELVEQTEEIIPELEVIVLEDSDKKEKKDKKSKKDKKKKKEKKKKKAKAKNKKKKK